MDLVHRGRPAQTPRVTPYAPFLSVAPWLPSAGAVLALGYVAGLSGSDLLVGPVSLVLLGLWRAGRSFLERHRLRSSADAWIARGHDDPTGWYGWRIAELTAPRERRLLARSLRAVVGDLSSPRLSPVAPLNRVALRPHTGLLLELAERLDTLERPVSAGGVLHVQRLITDPGSPLYAPPSFAAAVETPERTIRAVRDALEVH
jgi:hypothetical protein